MVALTASQEIRLGTWCRKMLFYIMTCMVQFGRMIMRAETVAAPVHGHLGDPGIQYLYTHASCIGCAIIHDGIRKAPV